MPQEAEAQETGVEGKRKQRGRGRGYHLPESISWTVEILWVGLPVAKGLSGWGKGALFLAVFLRQVGVEGQGIIGSLNVGPGRGPTN